MIITSIDDKKDLFFVENIFPENLLTELHSLNYESLPGKKERWQEEYNRTRLNSNQLFEKLNSHIQNALAVINQVADLNAAGCVTGFWLDGPEFYMSRHIDNSDVYATMQIYLLDVDHCPGTIFTDQNNQTRRVFEYCKNTGYIMINHLNQYHEVEFPVPHNKHRLCSYTWFYPKI